ncbi:MAG: hypothetical protein VX764_04425 [Planctomycetota bacterium]|nr:hypothetical protein [Planctomycetota bacterium]
MKTCLLYASVLLSVIAMVDLAVADVAPAAAMTRSIPVATTFDVVHTVATDAGGISDKLKKYGKYLRRAGSDHWKLESRKQTKPVPGTPKTVALPGKLGKAIISLDAKGVATVKILDNGGKSLGSYRSSRFPLVIANQRLRINGKPYVLILDRPKKK